MDSLHQETNREDDYCGSSDHNKSEDEAEMAKALLDSVNQGEGAWADDEAVAKLRAMISSLNESLDLNQDESQMQQEAEDEEDHSGKDPCGALPMLQVVLNLVASAHTSPGLAWQPQVRLSFLRIGLLITDFLVYVDSLR